jgi:two-component system response regulator HydG
VKRILVIDDDPAAVSGLRTLLELEGYAVVGVDSPSRGLQLLDGERFDALITDLEMPDVGGLEIVRHARQTSTCMLIFVITGYGGSPAALAAAAVGASRVFEKPLDYDALARELGSSAETVNAASDREP